MSPSPRRPVRRHRPTPEATPVPVPPAPRRQRTRLGVVGLGLLVAGAPRAGLGVLAPAAWLVAMAGLAEATNHTPAELAVGALLLAPLVPTAWWLLQR